MTNSSTALRVWDLPTRVFHWALAIGVVAQIVTGTVGGNAMPWHLYIGYWILSLLIFRVVWGVVGGYWSRFVQFFYAPTTIWRYLRGHSQPAYDVGHNPLGSLSVWGLLCLLLFQVGTGLISDDEIATAGPLVKFVSGSTSSMATSFHKHWGRWILITLIALHVAAILFYLFKKKQNLIKPMLSGDKQVASSQAAALPHSQDGWPQRLTALVLLVGITSVVFYGIKSVGG